MRLLISEPNKDKKPRLIPSMRIPAPLPDPQGFGAGCAAKEAAIV